MSNKYLSNKLSWCSDLILLKTYAWHDAHVVNMEIWSRQYSITQFWMWLTLLTEQFSCFQNIVPFLVASLAPIENITAANPNTGQQKSVVSRLHTRWSAAGPVVLASASALSGGNSMWCWHLLLSVRCHHQVISWAVAASLCCSSQVLDSSYPERVPAGCMPGGFSVYIPTWIWIL